MIDGFYAIYYTGVAGSGFGVMAFKSGMITGADAAGGTYDGSYVFDAATDLITGKVELSVPKGTPLVTGAPPRGEGYSLTIPLRVPSNFGGGQPLPIQTPTGPVNVVVKKLRDIPA